MLQLSDALPPRLTSHLQVVTSVSPPNKTAVDKAVTSDKSASIPQSLVTYSPPTSTLTINPGCDIHSHYTPLVVTDFWSESTCHGGQDNFTHHDSYDISITSSSTISNSPTRASRLSGNTNFAGDSQDDNTQPTSTSESQLTTISPSTILMRYSKPKKNVITGNMSLMKLTTIVFKSEDSAEQTTDSRNNDLLSNEESNPVELDDNVMTISSSLQHASLPTIVVTKEPTFLV